MNYMGGGTNTADGIKYVREQVYTQTGGARNNVPRITVVITDGQSSSPTQTAAEADKARQDNIGKLFVFKSVSLLLFPYFFWLQLGDILCTLLFTP